MIKLLKLGGYIILSFFLVAVLLSSAASASKRIALVIGNSKYKSAGLINPAHDAQDMAMALEQMGFDVIERIDADKRQMKTAVDDFHQRLLRSEIGLFYYAGHGMQINGANYLIPINADISSESDVEYESVHAGRILGKMREAGNRLNIVILDACRDNPFKRSFRTEEKGLAQMDAPKGTIIAYATSPGSVAADGKGRNGTYTKYLLKNIRRQDLTVQQVFNEAGQAVMVETNDLQIPWMSSTPVPRFYLAGGTTVVDLPKSTGAGSLKIKTSPSGAHIFIKGKDRGTAPVKITEIVPGRYKVRAELAGYKPEEKTVVVNKGRTALLTFYMDQIPTKGRIYVNTQPADAKVRIMNISSRYHAGMELDAGQYRVEVSSPGYQTRTESIDIESGTPLDFYVELEKEAATGSSGAHRAGETWTEPVTGMEFVRVPGGCFQMGSNSGGSDEKPVHEVCVDGFWIGKTEVTQGQWTTIMGSNPSEFKPGDDYPVETVSWNDAKSFIKKLNQRSGKMFTLPTEAQWEYAARSGGKDEKYSGGNNIDLVAWHLKNSSNKTHSVGGKAPNGLGIYDMTGNVWEWCLDVHDKKAYSRHTSNNPVSKSGSSVRVLRGGSWLDFPRVCRAAVRRGVIPSDSVSFVGFRLALLSGQ